MTTMLRRRQAGGTRGLQRPVFFAYELEDFVVAEHAFRFQRHAEILWGAGDELKEPSDSTPFLPFLLVSRARKGGEHA